MHNIQSGAVGLGAMVAVAVLRQIMTKIPKALLPWVAALIAALTQVALLEGDVNREQIIDAAVLGLAASGLWSGGGKYVTGKAGEVAKRLSGALKKTDPPVSSPPP